MITPGLPKNGRDTVGEVGGTPLKACIPMPLGMNPSAANSPGFRSAGRIRQRYLEVFETERVGTGVITV
jgi:hypothetical protein